MGLIQRFNLQPIIAEFKLVNFVETGTFRGDAVEFALGQGFERILSTEIQPSLFNECKARFANEPRVSLFNLHSPVFLRDHVLNLEGNCAFWLDAHFPGAEEGTKGYLEVENMEERLPLEAELKVIAERQSRWKDVLFIDDMWIYEDAEGIPSGKLGDHMVRIGKAAPGLRTQDINGNRNSLFVYETLLATHDIRQIKADNGYFVATPKQGSSK